MVRRALCDWRVMAVLAILVSLGWALLLIVAADSGSAVAYVGFTVCALLAMALIVITSHRFAARRQERSE